MTASGPKKYRTVSCREDHAEGTAEAEQRAGGRAGAPLLQGGPVAGADRRPHRFRAWGWEPDAAEEAEIMRLYYEERLTVADVAARLGLEMTTL